MDVATSTETYASSACARPDGGRPAAPSPRIGTFRPTLSSRAPGLLGDVPSGETADHLPVLLLGERAQRLAGHVALRAERQVDARHGLVVGRGEDHRRVLLAEQ